MMTPLDDVVNLHHQQSVHQHQHSPPYKRLENNRDDPFVAEIIEREERSASMKRSLSMSKDNEDEEKHRIPPPDHYRRTGEKSSKDSTGEKSPSRQALPQEGEGENDKPFERSTDSFKHDTAAAPDQTVQKTTLTSSGESLQSVSQEYEIESKATLHVNEELGQFRGEEGNATAPQAPEKGKIPEMSEGDKLSDSDKNVTSHSALALHNVKDPCDELNMEMRSSEAQPRERLIRNDSSVQSQPTTTTTTGRKSERNTLEQTRLKSSDTGEQAATFKAEDEPEQRILPQLNTLNLKGTGESTDAKQEKSSHPATQKQGPESLAVPPQSAAAAVKKEDEIDEERIPPFKPLIQSSKDASIGQPEQPASLAQQQGGPLPPAADTSRTKDAGAMDTETTSVSESEGKPETVTSASQIVEDKNEGSTNVTSQSDVAQSGHSTSGDDTKDLESSSTARMDTEPEDPSTAVKGESSVEDLKKTSQEELIVSSTSRDNEPSQKDGGTSNPSLIVVMGEEVRRTNKDDTRSRGDDLVSEKVASNSPTNQKEARKQEVVKQEAVTNEEVVKSDLSEEGAPNLKMENDRDEDDDDVLDDDDWTLEQHREFVSAIFEIGLKNCSPSVIMDGMQNLPPFITRERTKSHLQKYRKAADKSKQDFLDEFNNFLKDTEKAKKDNSDEKGVTMPSKGILSTVLAGREPHDILGGEAAALVTFSVINKCESLPTSTEIPFRGAPASVPVLTEKEKGTALGKSLTQVTGLLTYMTDFLLKSRHGLPTSFGSSRRGMVGRKGFGKLPAMLGGLLPGGDPSFASGDEDDEQGGEGENKSGTNSTTPKKANPGRRKKTDRAHNLPKKRSAGGQLTSPDEKRTRTSAYPGAPRHPGYSSYPPSGAPYPHQQYPPPPLPTGPGHYPPPGSLPPGHYPPPPSSYHSHHPAAAAPAPQQYYPYPPQQQHPGHYPPASMAHAPAPGAPPSGYYPYGSAAAAPPPGPPPYYPTAPAEPPAAHYGSTGEPAHWNQQQHHMHSPQHPEQGSGYHHMPPPGHVQPEHHHSGYQRSYPPTQRPAGTEGHHQHDNRSSHHHSQPAVAQSPINSRDPHRGEQSRGRHDHSESRHRRQEPSFDSDRRHRQEYEEEKHRHRRKRNIFEGTEDDSSNRRRRRYRPSSPPNDEHGRASSVLSFNLGDIMHQPSQEEVERPDPNNIESPMGGFDMNMSWEPLSIDSEDNRNTRRSHSQSNRMQQRPGASSPDARTIERFLFDVEGDSRRSSKRGGRSRSYQSSDDSH